MFEEEKVMTRSRDDKELWFVCDPCGIVCAVITYILVVYGEFVVLSILAPPFMSLGTAVNVTMFTTFGVLAVISHVKAMFTNPVSCYINYT